MWILSYDIERSGPRACDFTVAVGAALMDGLTGAVLHLLFLPGYVPNAFQFEPECWRNFWSSKTHLLEKLRYGGPLNFLQRQAEMIQEFQTFRASCEDQARAQRIDLTLVSDTEMFDKGFLNKLITDYTRDLPLPYRVSDGQYGTVWNVLSMQRGMLMALDPGFTRKTGFFRRIQELFVVPQCTFRHDHLPHHDAAYIAFQYWVLLRIQDGTIPKRQGVLPAKTKAVVNPPGPTKTHRQLSVTPQVTAQEPADSPVIQVDDSAACPSV